MVKDFIIKSCSKEFNFYQGDWFRVVDLFPTSSGALRTLLSQVIGVFSSAILLGESVGLRELVSPKLVVTALAVVMIRPY